MRSSTEFTRSGAREQRAAACIHPDRGSTYGRRNRRSLTPVDCSVVSIHAVTMELTVDGEVFSVLERPGEPGVYDFSWLTGPTPGHGFTIGTSDQAPLPVETLSRSAASFLAGVRTDTEY